MSDPDQLHALACQLVESARKNTTMPTDEVILHAVSSLPRGQRLGDCKKKVAVLYDLNFYRGGSYSAADLVSADRWLAFERNVAEKDREIDFGEVNGKHSEVERTWGQLEGRGEVTVVHGNKEPGKLALTLFGREYSTGDGTRIEEAIRDFPNEEWIPSDNDSDDGVDTEDRPLPPAKRVKSDDE